MVTARRIDLQALDVVKKAIDATAALTDDTLLPFSFSVVQRFSMELR